jgi:hypothetical protein
MDLENQKRGISAWMSNGSKNRTSRLDSHTEVIPNLKQQHKHDALSGEIFYMETTFQGKMGKFWFILSKSARRTLSRGKNLLL